MTNDQAVKSVRGRWAVSGRGGGWRLIGELEVGVRRLVFSRCTAATALAAALRLVLISQHTGTASLTTVPPGDVENAQQNQQPADTQVGALDPPFGPDTELVCHDHHAAA